MKIFSRSTVETYVQVFPVLAAFVSWLLRKISSYQWILHGVLALAISFPASAKLPDQFPESRPCVAADIKKTWRLVNLWEEIPGTYTREFRVFRYQYLAFDNNNYWSLVTPTPPKGGLPAVRLAMEKARRQAGADLRYIINKEGVIYLYRNQKVMMSARCNIVTKAGPGNQFLPGRMWLYESLTVPNIRIVRLYTVMTNPPPRKATNKNN